MSEKPQQEGTRSPELDMLNEIMDRATPHIPDPPEEGRMTETTALPTPGNTKRSSVYIYLAVLFGAAFMMLLLAYFVQQRNNAAVQDDLRSITASRQELLEDIQRLEEEKSQLTRQTEELRRQLEEQAEQYHQENVELSQQYSGAMALLSGWESIWALEQCYQDKDYEGCAVILLLEGQGQYGIEFPQEIYQRHEEIVQDIVDRGILAEDYDSHPSDYTDLIDAYLPKMAIYGQTQNVSRETSED